MVITLDWLTVLTGTGLPMLVALVSARVASGGVKATILAALSAVAGFLLDLQNVGGDFAAMSLSASASAAVTVFLIGVGAHFGLLKPLAVTGANGGIQTSVQGGVGSTGRHAA